MFGLFSKKKKVLLVHDKIWITEKAKFNACLSLKKSNPKVMFVAWFAETKSNLELYLKENQVEVEVYLADHLGLMQQDKDLIFVEHHPLQTEEHRIADKLDKKEITVFSSISEPIFQLFGGDHLAELMNRLGMKEDEMIEHNMISKSIMRAQEKIAQKTTQNVSAKSQKEWLLYAGHNH
ncbi:hypothetical protein FNJ88_13200 [Chryseobacterium sp. SNU WT5]|uniref:preprotein translocase subunit SecA n=1 Tax=Chryseobacterium sp. SNU WT5 TaxID=2594269 RepID=UPI001180E01F|nr:preprotein translocase subunit SecA [Chryseobacterium sp. SNU WT5]QDP86462.1 hypothetical protein FNJ88_13200 [Chryseobacterium sp. SNU WT5]